MSVPLSLKSNFFNVGDVCGDNVLGGFCHKKLETVKVKGSSKRGNWNYKHNYTYDDSKGFKFSDEIKMGFSPLEDMYNEMRLDRKGNMRYHLDLGQFQNKTIDKNNKYGIYLAVKCDTAVKNFWYRAGKNVRLADGEAHWRVEVDPQNNKMFALRSNMHFNDFALAGAFIYRHNDNSLQKYDLNFNFKVNENLRVGVKHLTPQKQSEDSLLKVGKLQVGGVYSLDKKNQVALKVQKNCEKDKVRAQLGLESQQCKHFTTKAKVDDKGKTTLMFKAKLNDLASLSLATQFNFQNGAKFVNFDNTIPLPLGYQLDLAL